MADDRLIMALDCNDVATRCILAMLDGTVVGFGAGGPSDPHVNGREVARASIQGATFDALQMARARTAQIEVIVAGSAGVGPNGEGREVIEKMLAELVPGAARVRATGDMVTAFWGALPTPIGVVVSAGLGSVCFGRNVTGEIAQVGGWGPLMGDEGSAYDIGLRALRAVARAIDGRGEPTILVELIATHLQAGNASEISRVLQTSSNARARIATLTQQVGAAAEHRDAVALHILRVAAKELATAALTALRQLKLVSTAASVSFSGSVFEVGAPLIDPFRRAVNDASPSSTVEGPLLPPIGGAFRLGLQTAGYAMDNPIIHHLARGLVEYDV